VTEETQNDPDKTTRDVHDAVESAKRALAAFKAQESWTPEAPAPEDFYDPYRYDDDPPDEGEGDSAVLGM
jgi:hypothetical protein